MEMHRNRTQTNDGYSLADRVECVLPQRPNRTCANLQPSYFIRRQVRRLLIALLIVIVCGCGNPEKSWELAEREDTNQAYLAFLAKYPEGEFADRARARIGELKEENAWERAQFRDRVDNYERYLQRYPSSQNSVSAQARITELRTEAAWETAREDGSLESLRNFLEAYPDAPQSAPAREMIAAIPKEEPEPETLPPPERAGEFRVQLGAFRTAAAAEREVRRLTGRFDELLLGPIRIVTPTEHGSSRFLLRSVPMSLTEARGNCQSLQQFGQDCFVINK